MFNKVCSFVNRGYHAVKNVVSNGVHGCRKMTSCIVAGGAAVLGYIGVSSGVASAQATTITMQAIDYDWTAFATSAAGKIAIAIGAAIGLGLTFWAVRMAVTKFKSFGSRG